MLSGSILPSRSFITNIELAPSVAAYARKPSVLKDANGLANDFGASGSPFFSSSNETF